ncbi:hypothetical protein GWI33_004621 [Rhynchophorus ferrugineus]|uniref:Uncharacterized protein n=1 Tax=Rhynchophorus ferrugineus TaxID=354439 RepID=A0A834IV01_RHYFE|nr:hypothetical protein GWI33_004621 [Rhynchophorus ferrugineus]
MTENRFLSRFLTRHYTFATAFHIRPVKSQGKRVPVRGPNVCDRCENSSCRVRIDAASMHRITRDKPDQCPRCNRKPFGSDRTCL